MGEGQIMMVIDLKEQPKNNTRLYSLLNHWYCLQSHMKSHEKESIHHIALSPNISSLEDEIIIFDLQLEEESDFVHAVTLGQYKLDKNFNLAFEETDCCKIE